jgi:hypothetical protein
VYRSCRLIRSNAPDAWSASGTRRTRPDFVDDSTPAVIARAIVSADPTKSTSRQRSASTRVVIFAAGRSPSAAMTCPSVLPSPRLRGTLGSPKPSRGRGVSRASPRRRLPASACRSGRPPGRSRRALGAPARRAPGQRRRPRTRRRTARPRRGRRARRNTRQGRAPAADSIRQSQRCVQVKWTDAALDLLAVQSPERFIKGLAAVLADEDRGFRIRCERAEADRHGFQGSLRALCVDVVVLRSLSASFQMSSPKRAKPSAIEPPSSSCSTPREVCFQGVRMLDRCGSLHS